MLKEYTLLVINITDNLKHHPCQPEQPPANMPIWVPYGLLIWGVQPGSAWAPYGLAHMRVAQMGPI